MVRGIMQCIMILFLIFTAHVSWAQTGEASETKDTALYTGNFAYQIGPGDTLQINVWRHPDLNMQIRVRPDCKIAFPLIDEIYVLNMTTDQLKKELTQRLSKTIRDPQVTVNLLGFQSKKFFVMGEVNQPGVFPYEGQEHILDAISKAMGYKEETAAIKSIIVIKRGYENKPKAVRVNLLDLIRKGDLKQDIAIEPGDIVFVPRTFISNVNKFVDQFFTKTDPVLKYYLDIYDIKNPGVLR